MRQQRAKQTNLNLSTASVEDQRLLRGAAIRGRLASQTGSHTAYEIANGLQTGDTIWDDTTAAAGLGISAYRAGQQYLAARLAPRELDS